MEVVKTREGGATTPDYRENQGVVKVISKKITVKTEARTDLVNISDEVRALVRAAGVEDGHVQVTSLHTTAGLFINEWQDALLADIKSMLDAIVPRDTYYRHNDPEFSDCDRKNSDSHLKNVVFGQSLTIPITEGRLVLGQWQSVILAEFDGPNRRNVFLQVLGI